MVKNFNFVGSKHYSITYNKLKMKKLIHVIQRIFQDKSASKSKKSLLNHTPSWMYRNE